MYAIAIYYYRSGSKLRIATSKVYDGASGSPYVSCTAFWSALVNDYFTIGISTSLSVTTYCTAYTLGFNNALCTYYPSN